MEINRLQVRPVVKKMENDVLMATSTPGIIQVVRGGPMIQNQRDIFADRLAAMASIKFSNLYNRFKLQTTKQMATQIHKDFDLPVAVTEQIARIIKSSKTAQGALWGIITLLYMDDYTYGREVMRKADTNKLDSYDIDTMLLLQEVSRIREDCGYSYEGEPHRRHVVKVDGRKIKMSIRVMMKKFFDIVEETSDMATSLDMNNGYFKRSRVDLKTEWENMNAATSKLSEKKLEHLSHSDYIADVSNEHLLLLNWMRDALIYALRLRVYAVAAMPEV